MTLLSPTRSKYSDEMRAQVIAYTQQGTATRRIEERLRQQFGYSPDHATIARWQQDVDMPLVTRGQSQQIIARSGELLHSVLDRLADISDTRDILKHGFLINAIRGTAMDKEAALANVSVNLSLDVQLNQVIANMGEADLERFIARGQRTTDG